MLAEIELPEIGAPWKEATQGRPIAARDALRRHRWAIALMDSRAAPGPATLRHHDAVIGCLRASGFSVAMTAHAFALIDNYLYGFALEFEFGLDLILDALHRIARRSARHA